MGIDDNGIPTVSNRGNSYYRAFIDAAVTVIDAPVTWFREKVVDTERPTYYWYHRKFKRVPTLDECYRDDVVCFHEANEQFKRDKRVDSEILNILRTRMEQCFFYEAPDQKRKCKDLETQYLQSAADWFTKYGDLGAYGNVRTAYMKQKHRMIWERRHGPVGTGMRPKEEWGTPYEEKQEEEQSS